MSNGKEITLVVDGVEVPATEGAMLVDAAKGGDVEIPVFCYEPKLGGPVGACRMCLVEVEGIPKLQTACSTPVRDGMVVYTQTDRVQEAQNAVVEFLLVNHPLDCPVCDKGGECPLQDISMGWGAGKSRVTDPKRHFQKARAALAARPDRPRALHPLLPLRPLLARRSPRTSSSSFSSAASSSFVGTFDDRPYIAPFHGNIIELCPVGALTSEAYRFRARPWDIEDAGSVCTLCPSQCNVKFTVRDEQVARVLARDNHEVDDGWLCDKGRFGFQMFHSEDRMLQPMVRTGGALHKATWDEALQKAADGLKAAGPRTAILIGSQASNEEGYLLQRIARQALGSPHVDSRARPGARARDGAGARPPRAVGVDGRHRRRQDRSWSSAPTPSTRCRSSTCACARRCETTARASPSSPSARPRSTAAPTRRFATRPAAPQRSSPTWPPSSRALPAAPAAEPDAERIAGALDPGNTVVIYGERIGHGPDGERALAALSACAEALNLSADGAGLIEVPETSNARGLREVGCLPDRRPRPRRDRAGHERRRDPRRARSRRARRRDPVGRRPIRELPDPERWRTALGAADFVLEVGMFGNASGGQADVFLPAESHAEKEGTVTHPDGRVQRVRPSVPHPGDTRHGWQWLAELAFRLGHETGIDSSTEALEALTAEVPFYAGLTHEEIGGTGVRWQDRDAGRRSFPTHPSALGEGASGSPAERKTTERQVSNAETDHDPSRGRVRAGGPEAPSHNASGEEGGPAANSLRLGTYRDLWAHEVTERSPALRFLMPARRSSSR